MQTTLNKLKTWMYWNTPKFITEKQIKSRTIDFIKAYLRDERIHRSKHLQPLLRELEKLRADTWNQDSITYIENYLTDILEVIDEQ